MWRLDGIPRLGWAEAPSPVERLADLAAELGIGALWVKRDDALGPLHGGTKTRKLDYLLATEPWAGAERWASVGAIGSGHLAAVVAAGRLLCRPVDAHVFFEPVSRGVEDNLAFTALGADRLRYAGGPVRLGLRYPALFAGSRLGDAVVIPAGGSIAPANVGLVRAGLELAAQIRDGDAPMPDRVYVALGSGGTAVGLAVGLAIAGVRAEVHGVDVVGRPVVSHARLRYLQRALVAWLRERGVPLPIAFRPPLPIIRRGHLGRGYGIPTAAGIAAADRLRAEGVPAEDVYTGKAFACLVADAPELAGRTALFWMTARADDPLLAPALRDAGGPITPSNPPAPVRPEEEVGRGAPHLRLEGPGHGRDTTPTTDGIPDGHGRGAALRDAGGPLRAPPAPQGERGRETAPRGETTADETTFGQTETTFGQGETAADDTTFGQGETADDDTTFGQGETTFGQGETTFGRAHGPWNAAEIPGWRDRLPPALRRRLEQDPTGALAIRRRRFLALGAGAAAVGVGLRRITGYDVELAWRGEVLSRREAATVAAAAAALLPAVPGQPLADGPSWLEIAANVDRFLVGAPKPMVRDVRGMLALVEQGTGLGGEVPRLTRLPPDRARAALEDLAAHGALLAQAVRGLRDLCMVGAWQDPRLWPSIGYDGPTIAPADWQVSRGRDGRPRPPSRYDRLLAPPRSVPGEDGA